MLTQKELKKTLRYEPFTGNFYWLIPAPGRKMNTPAGCSHSDGYRRICLNYTSYFSHRLAYFYMTGSWSKEIDHENHVRDDNRWHNLKAATERENQQNKTKQKNNTSGITGVSWCSSSKKWKAYIKVKTKTVTLGRFVKKQKAIAVRKAAEVMYGFHPNHGK